MSTTPSTPEDPLLKALNLIDPFLQFLTKATGHTLVPLSTLRRSLPTTAATDSLLPQLNALVQRGILYARPISENDNVVVLQSWDDAIRIGFPPPPSIDEPQQHSLHGSTKTAAKRRLAALKRILKAEAKAATSDSSTTVSPSEDHEDIVEEEVSPPSQAAKNWKNSEDSLPEPVSVDEPLRQEEVRARETLQKLFGFQRQQSTDANAVLPTQVLPRQASYAGSHPAQDSRFAELPDHVQQRIPKSVLYIFGLHSGAAPKQKLYRHQAQAVEAALSGQHVTVCTGTGSGKSLCFTLPVFYAAWKNRTSLVLFPTKALAQDQLSKLQALLSQNDDLAQRIRPATLDGDTPHSMRIHIATNANLILTNPDTLHAAMLPAWKSLYADLLARLQFVVLDEAHTYEGVFGAHVSMVLSRLVRVRVAAALQMNAEPQLPTFIAASATLPWPEPHFRRLFPIASDAPVRVLTSADDGSPRAEKHFFCWNPPILKSDGSSTGAVTVSRPVNKQKTTARVGKKRRRDESSSDAAASGSSCSNTQSAGTSPEATLMNQQQQLGKGDGIHFHRRHAADETAVLLARAIVNGIRCIAFCKTRNLVEWVYERALGALTKDPATAHLTCKLESYRGGYSKLERREIERKLFQNELLGVVGTNALELGVDIGGIDLTLHCGYPSSYASLLQQAGRAGRGAARLDVSSCAIVVCFNSPGEQHMWRHPQTILGRGVSVPNTIPINSGLVQGHLLCASEEFPLVGEHPVTVVQQTSIPEQPELLNDHDLFGGKDVYMEALEALQSTRSVIQEVVTLPASPATKLMLFKAHPSTRKPWSRVSIRSIEPVNFAVVDISHPGQGGKMDGIHDERAVMDTLPYSRVFFHAHPGAIITHRGRKYKVLSMTYPPAFVPENFGYRKSLNLAAFAKPTKEKYLTRPLSNLHITVVRPMERVECVRSDPSSPSMNDSHKLPCTTTNEKVTDGELRQTLAGCGALSVKRNVHGYKKLSIITRAELSRSELSLPSIEFETFGLWIDTEADVLSSELGNAYGPGVHALSHALLAVAPLFAPGLVRSDLECDHSFVLPTRVVLFDERAGGSGSSQRLWEHFFRPKGLLEAAIDLLEECSSCCWDSGYDGGCPACLHASNCIKFNMHLSRSAALVIGKRMLERIQETDLYQRNVAVDSVDGAKAPLEASRELPPLPDAKTTPRRKARSKALRNAKEMHYARERQFVVGRPSWPLDGGESQGRQVHGD